ncbi:MFS transporter [Rhodococcus fascians]|uniref:MFS transporter n=1 Tax=Nocardiaceae TaxID=85025 RepID=UPI0019D20B5D|nr:MULTISPECIES: MFS transporter [Rhodococcus]MBW4777760.1 MFS transporter [Rhodococcus fascians]MDJ0001602.1 MFS transporter [Rhodococcus fascians]MDJ0424361.1 MFS transporter [Rhodococcus fascians]
MKLRIACAVGTVVVFGLSLRLLFGSTSALTSDIAEFYSANSTSMALLTTGPVICLGVFAATARYFVRRVPVTHVLVVCLSLVAVGTAVRAAPSWPILVVGTLVAAAGIAVANVLGPVFVRLVVREWSLSERPRGREWSLSERTRGREWSLSERTRGREWSSTGEPDAAAGRRLGLLTGVLTAVISASAGVASGVSVPLAEAFDGGWRIVLGLWSIPVVLAAGSMAVFGRTLSRGLSVAGSATVPEDAPRSRTGVLTSPVAWSLTAFMGLQSLMAYSMIAWLPTIFRDRGVDARDAGLLLTALSVSSVLTALTVPSLATRLGNQSALAVAVTLPTCVGLLGIVSSADSWALVWAVLLGLGQGGQLSLAMTLMNLRASNARDAASLSSMAQTVGYVLAAAGPLVCGAVHSATQRWEPSIVFLLLVTIPMAAAGAVAGRRVVVGSEAEPADAVRGS